MPEEKKPYLKIGIYVIYIVFFSFILPFIALTAGRGLELRDFFDKVTYYYALLAGTMIGFLALYMMKIKKTKIKNARFGYAFIHSPQEGWLYQIKEIKFFRNPLKLLFISIILVSMTGLLGVFTNQAWVGLPNFEQQVTEGADVIISVYPASPSETTTELFVLFLLLSIVIYIQHRFKFSNIFTILMSIFVVAPLRAFFAVAIHALRYGAEEGKLIGIFIHRIINSMITFATGSVIYEYVWHDLINFFVKLSTDFSKDSVMLITTIGLGSFILLGTLLWIKTRKPTGETE